MSPALIRVIELVGTIGLGLLTSWCAHKEMDAKIKQEVDEALSKRKEDKEP